MLHPLGSDVLGFLSSQRLESVVASRSEGYWCIGAAEKHAKLCRLHSTTFQ